jgi:PAS domain S-box-containing protein
MDSASSSFDPSLETANYSNPSLESASEASQTAPSLFADIVRNMQVGLYVWHLVDPTDASSLQLVATNPAASKLTGVNLESAVGQKMVQLFPGIADSQSHLLDLYAAIAKTERAAQEFEIDYKDRLVTGCFNVKAFPLPDRCTGVVFENISERKRAEAAFKESSRHHATLSKVLPVGVFRTDATGQYVYVNQRWSDIAGISPPDALGDRWGSTLHPADRDRVFAEWSITIHTQMPFRLEYRFLRPDGNVIWVFAQATSETDDSGNVIGFVGTLTDITQHRYAEDALQERADELTYLNQHIAKTATLLQERNRELDQFAYVTSHDLKAPLRAIANLSEWIEEDLAERLPPENKHQMQLLRGRVYRMESLINGLLHYSRVGRTEVDLHRVDVERLLHDVIDSLNPPDSFRIHLADNLPILEARELLLQQVFANLISNAINHHHIGAGTIQIAAQEEETAYEFAVSDDGPGIDPKFHDKIFGMFQTLASKDNTENTGVGLAIVKKIVETEGGTIHVESQLGQGTTIRFRWPKQS